MEKYIGNKKRILSHISNLVIAQTSGKFTSFLDIFAGTNNVSKFFKRAGFHVEKVDYFDVYYPLALIPVPLRPLLQKLIHLRPFWPFAYLEATK